MAIETNEPKDEKLEAFKTQLSTMKPDGIEDEAWGKISDSLIDFHNGEVQALKITNAELKKEKTAEQDKRKALEAAVAECNSMISNLNEQLSKNSPEEIKKVYEERQKDLEEKFAAEKSELTKNLEESSRKIQVLENGVLQRDCLEEFNKVASDKNWLNGGREAALEIVLGENCSKFSRTDLGDGTSILANKDKQDIGHALNQFLGTELGKSFLRAGTSGGGAGGATGNPPKGTMTRAEFDALPTAAAKAKAMADGVKLV